MYLVAVLDWFSRYVVSWELDDTLQLPFVLIAVKRALVQGDLPVADRLHADDFQLINPAGEVWSKEQYLGGIASGEIHYQVWEPDSPIDVRLYGHVALMRYRSRLDIIVAGRHVGLRHYWHTDSYEQRNGQWQCVWSHATQIQ